MRLVAQRQLLEFMATVCYANAICAVRIFEDRRIDVQSGRTEVPSPQEVEAYDEARDASIQRELTTLFETTDFNALADRACAVRGKNIRCTVVVPGLDQKSLDSAMGNVNFHVRIRFEDEVCWIARIKRLNASTPPGSVRDYMISSEAATYKFLNTTTIPAPHLFDFACGAESPTGFGYILMEEVPGVPFSSLSPTLEQSRKVLEQLASVYDELEQHPFELMGSLTNTDDDTDGHIIGPLANELLADISSTGRDLIGPFTSSQAYYEAMIQRILNMIADGQLYPLWAVDAWLIHRFLLDLVPRLKECTPFASAGGDRNEKFFLRHADDKGDHILVDDDFNITGIIDWEWAYTAPRSEAFSSPMAFWDVAGFFDGRNDLSDDEQQLATLLDAVSSARGAAKDGLGRCVREGRSWQRFRFCAGYELFDWDWSTYETLFQGLRETYVVDAGLGWDEWRMQALERYRGDVQLIALLKT